jgi:hypothetical protein
MSDIVTLRFLVAVIFVLPIVALRLDVMLYAGVMTTEAYRVAVRDMHTDDELEVADRRMLGSQVSDLEFVRERLSIVWNVVLADCVESKELDPLPVHRSRVLQNFDSHSVDSLIRADAMKFIVVYDLKRHT